MSGVPMDWSHGPVPCVECQRPMRPARRQQAGEWVDTVCHRSGGRCYACAMRARRHAPAPEVTAAGERARTRRVRYSHHAQPVHLGTPMVYVWHALPGAVPMIHQEHEAIADMMDHLHSQGLLLCSRPRVEVRHGRRMTLRLHVQVRRAIGMVPDVLKGRAA